MRPISLSIDVTETCNFACSYCYKGEKSGRALDLPRYREALERFWPVVQERGGLSLSIMGGEPLTDFQRLSEVVQYAFDKCHAEELKFDWNVTTNLSLLTPEIMQFIESTRGSVHSSVDGHRHSQNVNRPLAGGQGSFEAVKRGIGVLTEAGAQRGARLTITPQTIGSLVENVMWLSALGYRGISAYPAIQPGAWTPELLSIVRQQGRILGQIRYTELKNVVTLNPFDVYAYAHCHGYKDNEHHCGACRSVLAMDTEGRIYPCHRFTGHPEYDHLEIKEPQDIQPMRQHFESALSIECLRCEIFGPCRGGCWAENIALTGSLANPPTEHCEYNRAFYAGVAESGIECPAHDPPIPAIAGEGSCVFTDFCAACDCSSDGCGSRDREYCGSCDYRDRCNVCDSCDHCHRSDMCRSNYHRG